MPLQKQQQGLTPLAAIGTVVIVGSLVILMFLIVNLLTQTHSSNGGATCSQKRLAADGGLKQDAVYRRVVLLTRWEGVGIARDGRRNDVKFMEELVHRHALYFPRGTWLRVVRQASDTADLVKITEEALAEGDRVFVGVLMSRDLMALKPLAQLYPDAIFISTASTAPALALPDNMFRLPCPDQRAVQYMGPLLDHTFPNAKKWIIQYDKDSKWAAQLHDMLRFYLHTEAELQMVHSWDEVDASRALRHAHHLGLMSLAERDAQSMASLRAQSWFKSLPKSTPLVFGDISAFSRSWSNNEVFHNVPLQIYAVTSLKMLAAVTVARNIIGHSVGPFLANLLIAGRLGVQALILAHNLKDASGEFHGRKVIQQIAMSRHTATGTGMFDDNGDRADIEVGIVEWMPQDADWRVVTTAGNHVALGPFDATFHK